MRVPQSLSALKTIKTSFSTSFILSTIFSIQISPFYFMIPYKNFTVIEHTCQLPSIICKFLLREDYILYILYLFVTVMVQTSISSRGK